MNVTKHFALAAAAMMLVLAGCPSEDEKVCSDFCGAGAACISGECVALSQDCSPACAANEACLMQDGAAACVEVCGDAQVWNADTNTCDLQIEMDHARYFNGFSDTELANGPAVTAECLKCHSVDALEMAGSAHFKWLGATPLLAGHETETDAIGKRNLINNFCVAVASNEQRCAQCHAGYGDPGTATTGSTPAYELTGTAAQARMDCLICHADMTTGYVKHTTDWGKADFVGNSTACTPACASTEVCWNDGASSTCVPKTARLKAAAKSIGRPGRANCGFCHYGAGGGDNVKVGDMASSLTNATADVDVHMGSTNPGYNGGNGLACVDCHVSRDHRIFGTGVNVAVSEGPRISCTDCHDSAVHPVISSAAATVTHLGKIACQTCHIPAFSRQLRTKMRWDWRLAGHKDCKFPVTAAEEAAWGDLDTDGDGYADAFPGGATCAAATAAPSVSWIGADGEHYEYDWRKGIFLKQDDVMPVYKYFDGRGAHLTTASAFTQAGTAADPVVIAAPTADETSPGAKIFPFKEMRGTQPGMADGSFLVVPYLYPMKADDGTTVPGALWSAAILLSETTETLQPKLNNVLTIGARAAGQIGAAETIDTAEWEWVETRMYMNINHEVAPATEALSCGDCHSGGSTGICVLPGVNCPF